MKAWLQPHGRISWTTARDRLSGCLCMWADLDGLHEDPPPADAPITTHLWAWSPKRLIRLRIDGTDCIGATLHLDDPGTGNGDPVDVTTWAAPTWPSAQSATLAPSRVSVDPHWRDRTITNYDVAGLTPLVFAHLNPKP